MAAEEGYYCDLNAEEDDEVDWSELQTYCDNNVSNDCIRNQMEMVKNELSTTTSNKKPDKIEETVPEQVNKNYGGPSRMSLNDHKAGMEGLDKEKINKIIYEASKGSKFYENELLKEQQVKERIQRQAERLNSCTDEEMSEAIRQADKIVIELEKTRDFSRTIVHIDMDAFYAAVEMRDDPSLRDKPMAVGGPGMLCTSNYVARKFGVRAAMPGFIGKKLCPDLIIVPTNFDKYRHDSSIIRNILKDYDPNFLPMSLDEAYLDLTDYIREREKQQEKRTFCKTTGSQDESVEKCEFGNSIEDIVKEIRFRIEIETQLTASAGIACNCMLAKICSDRNKPNGQFYLPSEKESVMKFVCDLPIRKISGIGRVSEQMLKALDIHTCNDIFLKRHIVVLLNSSVSSRFLLAISLGLGSTRVESSRERKSLSTERTFNELSKPTELYNTCQDICASVAKDCYDEKLRPRTVTLKLKTVNFQIKSRSVSFTHSVTDEKEIYEAAKDLLAKEISCCHPNPLRLRLMGVRLSNFENSEKKDVKQDKITSFLKKDVQETQCGVHVDKQGVDITDCDDQVVSKVDRISKTCFEAVCPVCNQMQAINDDDYLAIFNKHVDLCLNSVAIKEALSEQESSLNTSSNSGKRKQPTGSKTTSKSKRATLEHFWSK